MTVSVSVCIGGDEEITHFDTPEELAKYVAEVIEAAYAGNNADWYSFHLEPEADG